MSVDTSWTYLTHIKLVVCLEVSGQSHMTPSETSCMPLLERVGTMYGESGGMPLC